MSDKEMNVFDTLNAINVNDKIEKRGKFSYLSWTWAWSKVKEIYPDVTYRVLKNYDGMNYHHDGHTAWVEVGVTINGQEYVEHLPVMSYDNKSILVDKLTSFDVNKAIKRCLVKALALHGLGLYIYAGEDLPEAERETEKEPEKDLSKELITEVQMATLKTVGMRLEKDKGVDWKGICKKHGATSLKEMTREQHGLILKEFEKLENDKEKGS